MTAQSDLDRSVIFETAVRLVFHTVLVFSLYLLFAGHNQPGGGFVGGLVGGLALVLRYLSGGPRALQETVRMDPGVPLGIGMVLAAGTGMAAWLFGGQFLESAYRTLDLPLLGEVKATSPLLFDAGVYCVVIGLVLLLLKALGSGVDR